MKAATSGHRHHRGFAFEMWTSSCAWFWRLVDAGRDGGTIGAAGNEAEAVQEACATIERIIEGAKGSTSPAEFAIAGPRLRC